jgi:formate-dependent nitrite reductase cytochrome c552 subunit
MTQHAPFRTPLIPAVFIFCLAGPITAEALLRAICPQSQEVRIVEVFERSFFETADGLAEGRDDSAACMECHDGTTAKAVVLNGNDPNAWNRLADTAMGYDMPRDNHPVNVPYLDFAAGFVPRSRLDPSLRLKDGQVVCGTCHPFGAQLPNDRSRLCLSCHVK